MSIWWTAAGFIHLIENYGDPPHFNNKQTLSYFECVYCMIVTMSTVGYGDYTPNTTDEKIFAMIVEIAGVGGAVGTILVAVFAAASFGGNADADYSIGSQLTTQLLAALYTAVYTAIVSFIILKLIDATIGLRVNEREESEGLDIADHGETGYND